MPAWWLTEAAPWCSLATALRARPRSWRPSRSAAPSTSRTSSLCSTLTGSIRPPGTTGQQIESTVESLGGVAGDEALRIGLAIVTHYVPGAEWQPKRLSPGAGALALLAKTVPARLRPEEAVRTLAKAVEGAVVLEGERGEADEFAEMLLSDTALVP